MRVHGDDKNVAGMTRPDKPNKGGSTQRPSENGRADMAQTTVHSQCFKKVDVHRQGNAAQISPAVNKSSGPTPSEKDGNRSRSDTIQKIRQELAWLSTDVGPIFSSLSCRSDQIISDESTANDPSAHLREHRSSYRKPHAALTTFFFYLANLLCSFRRQCHCDLPLFIPSVLLADGGG